MKSWSGVECILVRFLSAETVIDAVSARLSVSFQYCWKAASDLMASKALTVAFDISIAAERDLQLEDACEGEGARFGDGRKSCSGPADERGGMAREVESSLGQFHASVTRMSDPFNGLAAEPEAVGSRGRAAVPEFHEFCLGRDDLQIVVFGVSFQGFQGSCQLNS